MIFLVMWIGFGFAGYMLALAVQLEALAARVARLEKDDKRKIWHTKADYARGLATIFLGPFAIVLVFLLRGK